MNNAQNGYRSVDNTGKIKKNIMTLVLRPAPSRNHAWNFDWVWELF